jgi:Fe/S biogenesis protein NfuA
MIQISDTAQQHFRKLIEREALPGLGVRLSAVDPGTPRADARLEFAELRDLVGDEWAVDCDGFTLYVDAASVRWLDGAEIDYVAQGANASLQIRAPKIKGEAPAESASLVERVRWVVEHEINPQLAQHKGRVSVEQVSAEGVVLLRFGGGCNGCGLVDVTLKQGIEKTLMARVPGVSAVRDVTDHSTGDAPYMPRETAA